MMMQRRLVRSIVPLFLLVVPPLAAQEVAPLGSVAALAPAGVRFAARATLATPGDTDTTRAPARDDAPSDTTGVLRRNYSASERFAMRSVVGMLGYMGGWYLVARATGPYSEYDGMQAPMAGGIAGTTLVISAMGYGDGCNGPHRGLLTAFGSLVGTAVGYFLIYNERTGTAIGDRAGAATLLLIPIAGGIGGAGGAALCTPDAPAHRRR
jgi:hypothetical protein